MPPCLSHSAWAPEPGPQLFRVSLIACESWQGPRGQQRGAEGISRTMAGAPGNPTPRRHSDYLSSVGDLWLLINNSRDRQPGLAGVGLSFREIFANLGLAGAGMEISDQQLWGNNWSEMMQRCSGAQITTSSGFIAATISAARLKTSLVWSSKIMSLPDYCRV